VFKGKGLAVEVTPASELPERTRPRRILTSSTAPDAAGPAPKASPAKPSPATKPTTPAPRSIRLGDRLRQRTTAARDDGPTASVGHTPHRVVVPGNLRSTRAAVAAMASGWDDMEQIEAERHAAGAAITKLVPKLRRVDRRNVLWESSSGVGLSVLSDKAGEERYGSVERLEWDVSWLVRWASRGDATVVTAGAELANGAKDQFVASKQRVVASAMGRILREAIARCKRLDKDAFFHKPVDIKFYSDYLDLVETPMDLSTLSRKATARPPAYATLAEFGHDLGLITRNALAYNKAGSTVCRAAQRFERAAQEALAVAQAAVGRLHAKDALWVALTKVAALWDGPECGNRGCDALVEVADAIDDGQVTTGEQLRRRVLESLQSVAAEQDGDTMRAVEAVLDKAVKAVEEASMSDLLTVSVSAEAMGDVGEVKAGRKRKVKEEEEEEEEYEAEEDEDEDEEEGSVVESSSDDSEEEEEDSDDSRRKKSQRGRKAPAKRSAGRGKAKAPATRRSKRARAKSSSEEEEEAVATSESESSEEEDEESDHRPRKSRTPSRGKKQATRRGVQAPRRSGRVRTKVAVSSSEEEEDAEEEEEEEEEEVRTTRKRGRASRRR